MSRIPEGASPTPACRRTRPALSWTHERAVTAPPPQGHRCPIIEYGVPELWARLTPIVGGTSLSRETIIPFLLVPTLQRGDGLATLRCQRRAGAECRGSRRRPPPPRPPQQPPGPLLDPRASTPCVPTQSVLRITYHELRIAYHESRIPASESRITHPAHPRDGLPRNAQIMRIIHPHEDRLRLPIQPQRPGRIAPLLRDHAQLVE